MRIIDMHCDTMCLGWKRPEVSFYDGEFSVTLKLLKEHESMVQFFAMFLPREDMETMDPYDIFKGIYGYYTEQMERYSHIIRPVYQVSDMEENRRKGLLSSLLTVEDGVFVDGDIRRLQEAYDMGVRLITLMWNYENCMGYPCKADPTLHAKGLKPFGIQTVEEMNRLGMIIDVAHMSEGGFYDVAKYSKKPFVASHSCARALCNHQRNLTDDQLRTLGNCGGVVGINFERAFLNEDGTSATFDRIIEHLLYMRDKAGREAIAFGSDLDGIEDNVELINYSGFPLLLERMERAFTDDEIDEIASKNVLRVMKEVIG